MHDTKTCANEQYFLHTRMKDSIQMIKLNQFIAYAVQTAEG